MIDIIPVIIAAVGLVVSILAYVKSNKSQKEASRLSNSAFRLTQGNVEIEVRNMIRESKKFLLETIKELVLLNNNDYKDSDSIKTNVDLIYKTAIEEMINAYEEACMKYIDDKIDKKRFQKTYQLEIRNLIQTSPTKEKIDSISSPYHAIKKVYSEWENGEQ